MKFFHTDYWRQTLFLVLYELWAPVLFILLSGSFYPRVIFLCNCSNRFSVESSRTLTIGEFSLYISVVSGTLFCDFTALSFLNSSFISLFQEDHRASLVLHHSLKIFSRQQAVTIIDLTLFVSKFLKNHCPFFLVLMT